MGYFIFSGRYNIKQIRMKEETKQDIIAFVLSYIGLALMTVWGCLWAIKL
jgi:hypothetical protein